MYSLPPTSPSDGEDETTLREALADALLTLIESGCAYVREHPGVKIKISRTLDDERIRVDLEAPDRAEGDGGSADIRGAAPS